MERDLRTPICLVKLAALDTKAILLSTTARPPINSPIRPLNRKLDANQATPLVVRVGWGQGVRLMKVKEGPLLCPQGSVEVHVCATVRAAAG